jgi:hypothetical protein
MKTFVKENWYKLMVGSSMIMASFGFMIYTISPVYSNSDMEKTEIKNTGILNSSVVTNSWSDEEYVYFVDGGYIYQFSNGSGKYYNSPNGFVNDQTNNKPKKVKLP